MIAFGRAARLRSQHFVKEPALLDIAGEDFPFIDVLIADGRREILPMWIFRVGWWIIRIRRNVAGTTGNADAIRTDELVVVVVGRIVHETIAVPFLARLAVELGIWKQSETQYAGRFAVNSFIDARRLGVHLLVQPQAKFIRLSGRPKSRFVHKAQSLETLNAWIFAVIQHLQKIHQTVAILGCAIPKMLVAAAPKIPGVAAHDFLRRKIDATIHRFEDVGRDLWKIGGRFTSRFRFIDWFVFFAAGKREKRACN